MQVATTLRAALLLDDVSQDIYTKTSMVLAPKLRLLPSACTSRFATLRHKLVMSICNTARKPTTTMKFLPGACQPDALSHRVDDCAALPLVRLSLVTAIGVT